MSNTEKLEKIIIKAPLEKKIGIEQTGQIKVGSQVLRQLSKGVYSSPQMAIKELISNSFDAEALEVTIDTKSKSNCIIIHDNGKGMDYKDFDENFTVISRSPKVEQDFTPNLKRPIIGRLGIGFIAVSELCNSMIVSSTTDKADTKFVATIDFSKYKTRDSFTKDFYEISDYTLINYEKKPEETSFTHIELRDLSPRLRDTLSNKPESGAKSRNFKKPIFSDIIKKIWKTSSHLEISKIYGPYWKFVFDLASIIPVEYLPNGPINDPECVNIIEPIKNSVKELNFKVVFDGMNLKKPYLLPTLNAKATGNYSVLPLNGEVSVAGRKSIKYRGYAYSQDSGIYVDDSRGLIVRVKNTSVGIVSQNFLDYPHLDSLYFKWTFGEIYVDEGLEEAMNIDRATFKKADPEYYEFVKDVHKKLQSKIFDSIQVRWRERIRTEKKTLENYKDKWRKRNLTKAFKKKFEFKNDKKLKKPIMISLKDSIVYLNPDSKILENFPRRERELLKDIIFAATLAREKFKKDIIKQEKFFLELLEDLAKNYPKTGLKYSPSKKK